MLIAYANMKPVSYKVKVCMLGDPSVGKTSLIRRFVYSKFDDKYISTLGTKISKKNMTVKDPEKQCIELTLMLWDVSGQREFHRIHRAGAENSCGAFIVTDLTRRETFKNLDYWVDIVRGTVGDVPIAFLANKSDLAEKTFDLDDLKGVVSEGRNSFLLTSAKTGENVEEAFQALGLGMLRHGNLGKPMDLKSKREVEAVATNLLALEDKLITQFCDFLGDTELGMMVVRQQFEKVGVDFRYPTLKGLKSVADHLVEAAADFKDPQSINRFQTQLPKLFKEFNVS